MSAMRLRPRPTLPTPRVSFLTLPPPASLPWHSRTGRRPMSSVTDISFWKSLIPRPFRSDGTLKTSKPKAKGWNPMTFYIIMFTLIGSMSIKMISLRKGFDAFMRQSDVRIGLLREVVERIQKGETVDVERILGTGDPESEQAWEEVLQEIEQSSTPRSRKKAREPEQPQASPAETLMAGSEDQPAPAPGKARVASTSAFY